MDPSRPTFAPPRLPIERSDLQDPPSESLSLDETSQDDTAREGDNWARYADHAIGKETNASAYNDERKTSIEDIQQRLAKLLGGVAEIEARGAEVQERMQLVEAAVGQGEEVERLQDETAALSERIQQLESRNDQLVQQNMESEQRTVQLEQQNSQLDQQNAELNVRARTKDQEAALRQYVHTEAMEKRDLIKECNYYHQEVKDLVGLLRSNNIEPYRGRTQMFPEDWEIPVDPEKLQREYERVVAAEHASSNSR